MSDPSRLEDLLIAKSRSAMSMANVFLSLADPTSIDHPMDMADSFKEMRRELDSLEASVCAVMRYSGVSWGNAT